MWVFTKNGFYSIVEDRNDFTKLMVRARVAGDLEKLFPDEMIEIVVTPQADYAFRTFQPRKKVMDALSREVIEINYDNFKHSVAPEREHFYLRVWGIMDSMQSFLGKSYKAAKTNLPGGKKCNFKLIKGA